jgi:hypothetical protein
MGFQFKAPRVNVAFEEGHEYHGLEVSLRKLNLQEFLDINGIGEVKDMHAGHQLKTMGEKLIAWNLEDEQGQPVPPTSDAVLLQDKDLMIAICSAWLDALRGVSGPFGAELARYRAIPGGVDSDGRPIRKPRELIAAETILRLCDRFHCLPKPDPRRKTPACCACWRSSSLAPRPRPTPSEEVTTDGRRRRHPRARTGCHA